MRHVATDSGGGSGRESAYPGRAVPRSGNADVAVGDGMYPAGEVPWWDRTPDGPDGSPVDWFPGEHPVLPASGPPAPGPSGPPGWQGEHPSWPAGRPIPPFGAAG